MLGLELINISVSKRGNWTSGANISQSAKFLFVVTKQASKLNARKNTLPSFLMWTDNFVAKLILSATWCYCVSELTLTFFYPIIHKYPFTLVQPHVLCTVPNQIYLLIRGYIASHYLSQWIRHIRTKFCKILIKYFNFHPRKLSTILFGITVLIHA